MLEIPQGPAAANWRDVCRNCRATEENRLPTPASMRSKDRLPAAAPKLRLTRILQQNSKTPNVRIPRPWSKRD